MLIFEIFYNPLLPAQEIPVFFQAADDPLRIRTTRSTSVSTITSTAVQISYSRHREIKNTILTYGHRDRLRVMKRMGLWIINTAWVYYSTVFNQHTYTRLSTPIH